MMQRDDLLAVTTRTPVQDTSEAAVERPSASAGLPSELSFVFEHWPGAVLHASPEGTYRPVNELGHSFISLLRRLDDDPENLARYEAWNASRRNFLAELPKAGSDASSERWQKGYYRGLQPDGSKGLPEHQTKVRPKPFRDGG